MSAGIATSLRQGMKRAILLLVAWSVACCSAALVQPPRGVSRRAALLGATTAVPPVFSPLAAAADAPNLEFTTARSGVQWADAKVGTGAAFQNGQRVAIDYVMSTTGARYGAKIDSTKDRQAPYSWTLGDGTTILGLEEAILGGENIPPMLPGGVRRIIVPSELAYADLAYALVVVPPCTASPLG